VGLQTVNENGSIYGVEQNEESANHPNNLMQEATFINQALNEQVLVRPATEKSTLKLDQPNPFLDAVGSNKRPASVGFVYRQWKLSRNVTIAARCEINGFIMKPGQIKERILIRALNEFDSQTAGDGAWRKRLNTQPGAVFASEMKNNRNKLAKWTAEACLAGVKEFRLAYVSRVSSQDQSMHHNILAVSKAKKNVLQPVAKESNLWATLLTIVDPLVALEDGEYIVLRDPNEKKLLVFNTSRASTVAA
jgi:translation initiation factor 3 subunit D